ncbi:hypothetical protein ABH945_006367 [Paraburkholderia sp. GAS333]
MNDIKQRKANLDSPNTTHSHISPSKEEVDAATIASVDCRHAGHSHCG